MGPAESLFNVLRSLPCTNSGLVVPKRVPHRAVVLEGFVDHVPCVDLRSVMRHNSVNVILKNRRELRFAVMTLLHPIRNLVVPDERMSAEPHVMALGKVC